MNADAIGGLRAGYPPGSQEPLYFPCGNPQLFAWLHHPRAHCRRGWGVVICKPFGYEALCGHRGMRSFADAAAALGAPTLRFDYSGCGDSADIELTADQIEVWTRDVGHAVAALRRHPEVERVCLVGFRLGALLALRAADSCGVEALALLAPVLSGRAYLKEARTMRLAALAADPGSTERHAAAAKGEAEQAGGAGPVASALEIGGYLLSAASVARLSRLDARTAAVRDVLLIDRQDLPVAAAWAQSLRERGVRTDYRVLSGFVEMMLTVPHSAVAPQPMLEAVSEWLTQLQPVSSPSRQLASAAHVPEAVVVPPLILAAEEGTFTAPVIERPVFLGPRGANFGIVTEPSDREGRRPAVILINTGADYHIGPSRMYVSLARQWARRGYYVLRMDLSGLGDSAGAPGQRENDVFPPQAVADVRDAVDYVRERYAIGEVTLLGLCSGAYHALRAASAGVAADRIIMVNPVTFLPHENRSLDEVQLLMEVGAGPAVYLDRLLSVRHWQKLFMGEVDFARIMKVNCRRLQLVVSSRLRVLARLLHVPLARDLGLELERVAGRGVRIIMVFAHGEPGINLLKVHAGSSLKRLGGSCRVRVIASADHTFSRFGPREALDDVLSEELFARGPASHN